MITVNKVTVGLINGHEKVKAIVSVTLNESLLVRGIRIIEKKDKQLLVAMPNRKDKNGNWKDTVQPLTSETRELIEAEVIKAYNEKINQ